jgi:hypothetical protein
MTDFCILSVANKNKYGEIGSPTDSSQRFKFLKSSSI